MPGDTIRQSHHGDVRIDLGRPREEGGVDRLYVGVAWQGRGIGTALLDEARRRSPERVRLFTHQQNVGACRFYERRGFVPVRYGVSPPPECEPDVEYWWQPGGVASPAPPPPEGPAP